MSDGNRVALRYVKESTWGTTPATPTMQAIRYVNESLKQDTQNTQSNEVRSDRMVADLIRTGINTSGSVSGEMSYGTWDDWLVSTLQSTAWTAATQLIDAVDVSAAAADQSFNSVSASFGTLVVNQWILVKGFVGANNNGYFKILTKTTTKITVTGGSLLTNEAAGPTVKIQMGGQIVNGTTFESYSIERQYADLSNEFVMFTGKSPETWDLGITANGILTTAFGFLGKKELSASATAASVLTPVTTSDVMNGIDDVSAIMENRLSVGLTELTTTYNNNLRARLQIGTLGAISLGSGSIGVTGNFVGYYTTKAQADRYLNFSTTNLAFALRKAEQGYVIEFPAIKFLSCERVGGGINTDVLCRLTYGVRRDSTEGIMARIARFPVPS